MSATAAHLRLLLQKQLQTPRALLYQLQHHRHFFPQAKKPNELRNWTKARRRTFTTTTKPQHGGWYSRMLDQYPIITKSITSALIAAGGDVLSQWIEWNNVPPEQSEKREQQSSLDVPRASRFGLLGLVLVGPFMHYWFGALMRWFPQTTVSAVVKRVAVDQFINAPLFVCTFVSSLWYLEGQKDIFQRLRAEAPDMIVANWSLWIPAQAINFAVIPGKYQVLFSNFAGFIWNAYLSFTTHNSHDPPADIAEK